MSFPELAPPTPVASKVFKFLFWIHQVVLGLPSMFFAWELLAQGKATGIINVIGVFLAWIGGTLVWGLAAIIHQNPLLPKPMTNPASASQTGNGSVESVLPSGRPKTYRGYSYVVHENGATLKLKSGGGLKDCESEQEAVAYIDVLTDNKR
jgi:hypothetical protein